MFQSRRFALPGAAQRGEVDAAANTDGFERMWQDHEARVERLVVRLAGGRDSAEDLLQETRLRAYQGFPTYQARAGTYTWLYRIAVNVVLRWREQASRRTDLPLDHPQVVHLAAQEPGPERRAVASSMQPLIWAALNRLPEDVRATIVLQLYQGLKYREIADVLEIPIGTVKSRLNFATLRLREELKDYEV